MSNPNNLAPLDFSSYRQEDDIPEVAALKQRVIEVAMKMKERHGFCSEVDRALREAGVTTTQQKAVVHVATVHGLNFTVKVDPDDYEKLTLARQVDKVLASVGALRSTLVPGVEMALEPEHVTTFEVLPLVTAENGLLWRYTSRSGTVLHAMPVEAFDPESTTYPYTLCDWWFAIDKATEESLRPSGTRCRKCERRAAER